LRIGQRQVDPRAAIIVKGVTVSLVSRANYISFDMLKKLEYVQRNQRELTHAGFQCVFFNVT